MNQIHLQNISCGCRRKCDGRKCNSRQKWNKDICINGYMIYYKWNPSKCACKCDKDCEIGGYMKEYEFTKIIVNDLVLTCNKVVDTPKSTSIKLSDGINYWIIAVVLLAMTC